VSITALAVEVALWRSSGVGTDWKAGGHLGGACCWPRLLGPFTESLGVRGDGSLVPGADSGFHGRVHVRADSATRAVAVALVGDLTYGAELLGRGQVPGVGVRSQLVETTGKVLVVKRPMPDLVSCLARSRPPT
jgi:hypothetical protein